MLGKQLNNAVSEAVSYM